MDFLFNLLILLTSVLQIKVSGQQHSANKLTRSNYRGDENLPKYCNFNNYMYDLDMTVVEHYSACARLMCRKVYTRGQSRKHYVAQLSLETIDNCRCYIYPTPAHSIPVSDSYYLAQGCLFNTQTFNIGEVAKTADGCGILRCAPGYRNQGNEKVQTADLVIAKNASCHCITGIAERDQTAYRTVNWNSTFNLGHKDVIDVLKPGNTSLDDSLENRSECPNCATTNNIIFTTSAPNSDNNNQNTASSLGSETLTTNSHSYNTVKTNRDGHNSDNNSNDISTENFGSIINDDFDFVSSFLVLAQSQSHKNSSNAYTNTFFLQPNVLIHSLIHDSSNGKTIEQPSIILNQITSAIVNSNRSRSIRTLLPPLANDNDPEMPTLFAMISQKLVNNTEFFTVLFSLQRMITEQQNFNGRTVTEAFRPVNVTESKGRVAENDDENTEAVNKIYTLSSTEPPIPSYTLPEPSVPTSNVNQSCAPDGSDYFLYQTPRIDHAAWKSRIEKLKQCPLYEHFSQRHSMCLEERCLIEESGISPGERSHITSFHNALRTIVAKGIYNNLPTASNMYIMKWDDELANIAKAWATQCLVGYDTYHERTPLNSHIFVTGQNVYDVICDSKEGSIKRRPSWDYVLRQWASPTETVSASAVHSYEPDHINDMGNFIQMIWAKSYLVGCASASCGSCLPNINRTSTCYKFVCNYGPAGNYVGEKVYDFGNPALKCPNGIVEKRLPALCATPIY